MSNDELSPGRGRGRGRGRPVLRQPLFGIQSEAAIVCTNANADLLLPRRDCDQVDSCAIVIVDKSRRNLGRPPPFGKTEEEEVRMPPPKLLDPLITTAKMNGTKAEKFTLPERLIKRNERLPISVVAVSYEDELVYVKFEDTETVKLRRNLRQEINRLYSSSEAIGLRIKLEDMEEGGIAVVGDVYGNFYRAKIPPYKQLHENDLNLADLDSYEQFQMNKMKIYQLTQNIQDAWPWFQVVPCAVELAGGNLWKKWKEESAFLLQNSLMQKCLISALELSQKTTVYASNTEYAEDRGILKIGIDVFQSSALQSQFISSVIYATIPRLPAVKQKKIGMITNVGDDGIVHVVFYSSVWGCVREVLKTNVGNIEDLRKKRDFTSKFKKEMIENLNFKEFVGFLENNWSELHRVKIISTRDDELVNVLYYDLGKLATVPYEYLIGPINSDVIQEIVRFIQPQAVPMILNGIKERDYDSLRSARNELEGKVCFTTVISEPSDACTASPIVEIWIENDGKIISLVDYIRLRKGEPLMGNTPPGDYSVVALKMVTSKMQSPFIKV